MVKLHLMKPIYYIPLCFLFLFCNEPADKTKVISKEAKAVISEAKHPKFNSYWSQGKAEITSYQLTQSRYGEIHEGTAVNIFVSEDFLPGKQVKADSKNDKNIPVLKLNSTKKFVTGMYPYSLMTSTFSPINTSKNAVKISFSSQEWCGNTFVQLNNREQFEIDFHSYFERNADRKLAIKKAVLENDLWNTLRINPKNLPIGKFNIIPSFEFLALNHQEIKSYTAETSLKKVDDFILFTINYPSLERTLTIKATQEFPFSIESWEETILRKGKKATTKATRIKTIQAAYWNKNGVSDTKERKALGL